MFHTLHRMKCKQMESNTRKLGRKKGFLCQIIKRKVLAGQSDWASECRARAVIKEGANICLSLLISRTGWDTEQLMASVEISYLHLRLHSHLDPSQKGHVFCSRRQTLPLFSLISAMMKHSYSPPPLCMQLHSAYKSRAPIGLDESWTVIHQISVWAQRAFHVLSSV